MAHVNLYLRCVLGGLLFALLPLVLASPPPSPGSFLTGTVWVLESLNSRPALGRIPVTLDLGESTFGGHSGCNRYGGAYRATATRFAIVSYQMTLRGCAQARLRQEAAYAAALGKAVGYRISGDRMELASGEGSTLLVFRKETHLAGRPDLLIAEKGR